MLLLLQLLLIALSVGVAHRAFRRGTRTEDDERARGQTAAMQGALLGLLGLLLGFTASMAENRFAERRGLILAEANAIGTAYLRADLLPGDRAAAFRALLSDYVDERLAFYDAGASLPAEERATRRANEIQAALWEVATADVATSPDMAALVIDGLNEVIDLEGARHAALDAHLPTSLVLLLVVVGLLALASTAFAWGQARKRSVLGVLVLPALVGISIGVVLDLDAPRVGLIRSGQAPMEHLRRAIDEG